MPNDITRIINKIKTLFSEITEVERIENGCFKNETETFSDLPSLCRVVIVSKPGKGSLINSELWLPDNWNGVFIGCGNGGMAGAIRYEKLTYYSKLGYAVANTDMGTSGDRNRGIDNPDVWKDFGWRATHVMTEISKAIIKEYYGKKESYSYFVGESTGGQQAYSEAQRFPEDYNGMPIGSEVYTCGIEMCQKEESPFFYPFIWAFGEDYDGYEFDFSADLQKIHSKLSSDLNANNTDLSKFYDSGGKLMAYSGSADPCVPYPDAIKYYNRVCEKMGGYEIVKSFFKFYILPGKQIFRLNC